MDVTSSVWLTGFWGFDPEEDGVLGFTDPRDRDRLFKEINERQLICVYGAASPETDRRIVRHLLGVLEVERKPIDSWDKISDTAKKRNIDKRWQNKWRHAMPVRRAWRTKHTLDVTQVFPKSYDPKKGRYIAKFGTWLVPEEARWLLEKVPLTQANVFGEPPLGLEFEGAQPKPITNSLKPSQGIFGDFGNRSFEVQDKPHHLYLAHFPSSPELLAGQNLPSGAGVVKIGITGNITNRLKELNISFPQTAKIGWEVIRTAPFCDRSGAAEAEDAFKVEAIEHYGAKSLGKEFFIIEMKKAEALFNELSVPTGLDLRVADKTAKSKKSKT